MFTVTLNYIFIEKGNALTWLYFNHLYGSVLDGFQPRQLPLPVNRTMGTAQNTST